jgi:RNA polymerase sigma factor (sigma-70 family)
MADFNTETLNELLVQCIDKQPQAQKKLFDILSPRMFAICLRYAKNEDEAKDLLQEGFIKIFNNLEQFSNKGSLEGWFKRIFINTCIEFHRKNQKHRFLENIENVTEISIDSHTISLLKKADLMKMVQGLPKGYRTVFNLFVVDGFGHNEIAQMLSISENTSKTQLFRARQILQEMILKQDLK